MSRFNLLNCIVLLCTALHCAMLVHRTWVNEPKKAAAQVELLTRDADCPEEASGEDDVDQQTQH